MTKFNKICLMSALAGLGLLWGCNDDDSNPVDAGTGGSENTGGAGNTNPSGAISANNTAKVGGVSIAITTVTCEQNTFGRPRFVFTASDDNAPAGNRPKFTVQISGTEPEVASYPLVSALGDSSAHVELYYDAKNYTSAESGSLTYTRSGTLSNAKSSTLQLVNARDENDKIEAQIDFTCSYSF